MFASLTSSGSSAFGTTRQSNGFNLLQPSRIKAVSARFASCGCCEDDPEKPGNGLFWCALAKLTKDAIGQGETCSKRVYQVALGIRAISLLIEIRRTLLIREPHHAPTRESKPLRTESGPNLLETLYEVLV